MHLVISYTGLSNRGIFLKFIAFILFKSVESVKSVVSYSVTKDKSSCQRYSVEQHVQMINYIIKMGVFIWRHFTQLSIQSLVAKLPDLGRCQSTQCPPESHIEAASSARTTGICLASVISASPINDIRYMFAQIGCYRCGRHVVSTGRCYVPLSKYHNGNSARVIWGQGYLTQMLSELSNKIVPFGPVRLCLKFNITLAQPNLCDRRRGSHLNNHPYPALF